MLVTQTLQLTVAVLPALHVSAHAVLSVSLPSARASALTGSDALLPSAPADVATCLVSLKASPISTLAGPVALQ